MSTPKRFLQSTQNLFRPIWRLVRAIVQGFMNRLLRVLVRRLGHPSRLTQQGFVLPTVVMVMLVVTLLTTAIVFRSFDRAKNASNFRVNQAVLNAATPAIDRAKAKLEALFSDPNLPRGTPSEVSIENVLNNAKYELGDEDRITLENAGETLTTAWRFPVDTDNNGLYDSISLYGIYFSNPDTSNAKRTPLDARTPPMVEGETNPACAAAVGTSASLVGTQGWYKVKGDLKKAFFVYVATVPITEKVESNFTLPTIGNNNDYENYTGGNRGFSALEYQQDVARIPLSNNAIVYEDDVEMAAGRNFAINGRIFTNSNLLPRVTGGTTSYLQVSAPDSCFYEAENGKIVVGGNYVHGNTHDTGASDNKKAIEVDLFQQGNNPTNSQLDTSNGSVSEASTSVAYNTQAYAQRIDELVELTFDKQGLGADPQEVRDRVNDLTDPTRTANPIPQNTARRQSLEIYFRNRTRRVPFAEVATDDPPGEALKIGGSDIKWDNDIQGKGTDELRPPDAWMFPFATAADGSTQLTSTSNTGLTLNQDDGTPAKLNPPATKIEVQQESGDESLIGDRVLVGNNLPALWYKNGDFVGEDEPQPIQETQWDQPDTDNQPRERFTRVRQLDELDTIARDGFWETKAAEEPKKELDGVGGLRIVTGAGVYLPFNDNIAAANASQVVWPDTMPVIPHLETDPANVPWLGGAFPTDEQGRNRPFLKMRASAVYYYTHGAGRTPIACVDNYYDPTDDTTVIRDDDGNGVRDNGQVYGPPATEANLPMLRYQANLVYPNGRPVNQVLRDALAARFSGDPLTLAQQAAIDSTSCALSIYDTLQTGTLSGAGSLGSVPGGYILPDGTIRETAFLDARQVKVIDQDYNPASPTTPKPRTNPANAVDPLDPANPEPVLAPGRDTLTGRYDLPIEQRYPLEIRVTQIDLEQLRNSAAASLTGFPAEFMFPNSGIIYATRDDALLDVSSDTTNVSATDFRLDPTRRPNGIMLISGGQLGRRPTFAEVEKGLILASNLPVYVKGEFNVHTQDEFTGGSGFYDRTGPNPEFACRPGDTRLPGECRPDGDDWRAAAILADAVTVLSADFNEGVRVDGDYDLRNNQIDNIESPDTSNDSAEPPTNAAEKEIASAADIEQARLARGFWNNNFVTSRNFTDTDYSDSTTVVASTNSSYFNNFVTPIQRRATAPEYVMEICRKLPVSDCEPNDWVTGYDINGDNILDQQVTWFDVDGNGTPGDAGDIQANIKASDLAAVLATRPAANGGPINAFSSPPFDPTKLAAGTTKQRIMVAAPPYDRDQRFARRVAFLRYTKDIRITNPPVPAAPTLDVISNADIRRTPSDPTLRNNQLVLHRRNNAATPACVDTNPVNSTGTCWTPIPIGINNSGALEYYTYNNANVNIGFGSTLTLTIGSDEATSLSHDAKYYDNANRPRTSNNTLWYQIRTRPFGGGAGTINYGPLNPPNYTNLLSDETTDQPLLVPVLQLQYPTTTDAADVLGNTGENNANADTNWLQRAATGITITNMMVATGDTPSRPSFDTHDGDFSGGVPNLVRFIENWGNATSEIAGSFIQIKRSAYATAPYFPLPSTFSHDNVNTRLQNTRTSDETFKFDLPQIYTIENARGKIPYFAPPTREWGFDVGILSQLPDLFAQQFTTPPTDGPNEFYREVSRDDDWVQTLLCAKLDATNYAINENQRPNSCP